MARRTAMFLKEGVILVGFLNGVWLAVGVNPTAQLLGVLEGAIENVVSGTWIETLFVLLPLAITVGLLVLIFKRGGWLGLLAVACAFLGGAQIVANPATSLVLLLAAMGLGYVATK